MVSKQKMVNTLNEIKEIVGLELVLFSEDGKRLDTGDEACYHRTITFICQMRLSGKSSPKGCCRELPDGARQSLGVG